MSTWDERWDPQWLIASDGSVAQIITDQFQPRIGAVYQPGVLGTQKITASYGRFYEALELSLSQTYHVKGVFSSFSYYPNDPRVDTTGGVHFPNLTPFVANVPGVHGQYFDEFTLGYERQLPQEMKLGIRGHLSMAGAGSRGRSRKSGGPGESTEASKCMETPAAELSPPIRG